MPDRPPRSPNDEAAIAWTAYTDSLEEEIERLRAALTDICALGGRSDLPEAWEIARAALKETP